MLSVEAVRLAAVEVLNPYAANVAGDGFPTLAGRHVFDSRSAALDEIDRDRAYTPVLSIYSAEAERKLRGAGADWNDADLSAVLEIVAELAVVAHEDNEDYVDAVAGDDPDARLVLAALCGQVESILMTSEAGYLFRRFCISVDRIELVPFAVANLGLRWQRTLMRVHCTVPADDYTDAGGLPPKIAALHAALPAGSYAKTRLGNLADAFAARSRTALATITWSEPDKAADADPDAGFEIPQGD